MFNKKYENNLLKYLGLKSHSEIMDYVRENPEDKKVKEIKELLNSLPINSDREVDRNEK